MFTSSQSELAPNEGDATPQGEESREHSTDAEALTPSQRGDRELALALQARSAARYLSEVDDANPAVLVLRRLSVLLWFRLLLQRQSLSCPETSFGEEHWKAASELQAFRALAAEITLHQMTALQEFLADGGDLRLLKISPQERRILAGALARAERTLSQSAMDSNPEPIVTKLKRNWRVISVTLLVLVLGAVAAVKIATMGSRPNLALHRPVQLSSVYGPEFPNGEKVVDSDPTNVGFHTQKETNPFAIIDLGQTMPIHEIVVHNRADCCQDRAVPLLIEVSNDGQNYKLIAEREEPFDRWIAKNLGASGRYVRLKVNAVTLFHLAEVEIF